MYFALISILKFALAKELVHEGLPVASDEPSDDDDSDHSDIEDTNIEVHDSESEQDISDSDNDHPANGQCLSFIVDHVKDKNIRNLLRKITSDEEKDVVQKYYNRGKLPVTNLVIGQHVLVRQFPTQIPTVSDSKFLPKWTGPKIIKGFTSPVSVLLEDPETSEITKAHIQFS
ncbi:hypothetical protein FQR65_LT15054 [Abscondita terminalis]|nr:hypothetical protein FQR65_LT15054 [Abscondita terminalis]